jgi:hypothetical protein
LEHLGEGVPTAFLIWDCGISSSALSSPNLEGGAYTDRVSASGINQDKSPLVLDFTGVSLEDCLGNYYIL